ncbi:hypothetical protein [Methyloterricola oryzae]|uniref:hypothetical protein n=1 Tax=Methyloterricola oryzae TaxID=1495050 RepID=UPI0005EAEED2|nr:hypothetical protein [Methyloterricola oryzae]
MGILDEIKKEAERLRKAQEAEDALRSVQERNDAQGLRERMVRIQRYLFELVDHLEVVGWPVDAVYSVPGVGDVSFSQGNYRIFVDNASDPKKISLRFDCLTAESRHYSVTPRALADDFRKFLRSEQVAFSESPIRSGAEVEGALFECRLRVLVSLLFETQEESFEVGVTTHNFEGLVDVKLHFPYQKIDEDWLDQLGHYVLRKDRRLSTLEIPDDVRRQLRQRLEEDNRRRQAEQAEPRKEAGFFARLGSLLRRPAEK